MQDTNKTTGAPGWRELRQARIERERAERKARTEERMRQRAPAPAAPPPREQPAPREKAPARSARPRIGFITPGAIEFVFLLFLYAIILSLVVLSVLGTFYGIRGESAPIFCPVGATDPCGLMRIYADVRAGGSPLRLAIIVQVALTLCQYGARVMAKHDRRWWLLYVAALGVSVYYNIQAYWTPAVALMPTYAAVLLIVSGDVLPEFMAVRHD